jgi:hypothetical protein
MGSNHPFREGESRSKRMRIGELNGAWSTLLKVVLVIIPLSVPPAIGWATWVTNKVFEQANEITKIQSWQNQAPRFTQADAENLRLRVLSDVNQNIGSKLSELQNQMESMRRDVLKTQILMEQHLETSNQKPKL